MCSKKKGALVANYLHLQFIMGLISGAVGAAVGAAVGVSAAPLVIGAVGFTSVGIAAGELRVRGSVLLKGNSSPKLPVKMRL